MAASDMNNPNQARLRQLILISAEPSKSEFTSEYRPVRLTAKP